MHIFMRLYIDLACKIVIFLGFIVGVCRFNMRVFF